MNRASLLFTDAQQLMDETAQAAGTKEFVELWNKKAPSTLGVPEFPSNFVSDKATGDSKVQGDLFPVNFFTPHSILSAAKQVNMGSDQS
jgi:F-type H+-transporting ATPase subunit delta